MKHDVSKRLQSVKAVFCAFTLMLLAGVVPVSSAVAADGVTTDPGRLNPDGVGLRVEEKGVTVFWLGTEGKYQGWDRYCVQYYAPDPADAKVVDVTDLDTATPHLPGWEITTPQMAYLLSKYNNTQDSLTAAGISFLIHANFEIPGVHQPQESVDLIVSQVKLYAPQIQTKASQLRAEAVASAAVGYEKSTPEGAGKRTGQIKNIAVKNAAGAFITNTPVSVTLNGPAVFTATGTNTWSGKTSTTPISLEWKATGNGKVTYQISYKTTAKKLSLLDYAGNIQKTVIYPPVNTHSDPVEVVNGPAFNVVYDFQPLGISNVVKISENGKFVDVFDAKADPDYGEGSWLELDDTEAEEFGVKAGFVPVKYRATAYYVGENPPVKTDSVPAGSEVIGSKEVVANGPGRLEASFETDKPGFVTVVWEVVKADQGNLAKLIHADWQDGYGVPEETVSHPYEAEIDSALSIRETKSGVYLVDDLFVTGMPSNHPDFAGDGRFKADVKTIQQELFFFPDGLEVVEANKDRAEKIGGTLQVPAKNGFYPSLGATDFKVKQNADGTLVPGTYVFVTSFAGDDRVKPLTTSVEDKAEQYVVSVKPDLHTTLLYEDAKQVPSYGKRVLTDRVCYTNLTPGKEYELAGTLMDKASGKPLTDVDKTIQSFKPETANGCTEVAFTVDAGLFAGKTVVAFETLSQDGREIVVHADITDENQSLVFPPAPKLKTTATDKVDGDKVLKAESGQVIVDRVCDVNKQLKPGTEYEIHSSLMLQNGSPVVDKNGEPVMVKTKFVPQTADECANVEITFDATKLASETVVVFEDVLQDGVLVSAHHDLQDKDQSVSVDTPPVPSLAVTGSGMLVLTLVAVGAGLAGVVLLRSRKKGEEVNG